MTHVLTDVFGSWQVRRAARQDRLHEHSARHAADVHPPLEQGERVLTRAGELTSALVGTNRALFARAEHDGWHRIRWADIRTIGWSRADQCLEVRTWSAESAAPSRLAANPRFAAFAAERVRATRLLDTHAEILPGVAATVVAVRTDGDDEVQWRIAVGHPGNVEQAVLDEACARIIAELHGLAGC